MNGHDTDPTPPHGTERPAPPDRGQAARTYLATVYTTDPTDRLALDTLSEMVDALALAVRLSHSGDLDILAHVLVDSGRDWFGWFRCPSCHANTAPDERGESGYCMDCDEATADDQDRDAYGAPYGGRDDLDD